MTRYTEKQMRLKISQFIKTNFKNVAEYARHYGFNAEACRQSLRGDRPLSTGMVATVSDRKIPILKKEVRRFYEYAD